VLMWINNINMEVHHIEVDCLQVVQAINSGSKNNSKFSTIITECRKLLNLNQNCKVGYVQRQANRIAHNLAQAIRLLVPSLSIIFHLIL
jgi:hypothetical protein